MHDRYDLGRSSQQIGTTLAVLGLLAWVLAIGVVWAVLIWMVS